MKSISKKLLVAGAICFACVLICAVSALILVGCGNLEQKKTEARIRHYFGLGSRELITDSTIETALVARFPIGTPVGKLETWLTAQGLGVDGNSITWQTNQYVSYQVNDYSDAFLSMRHVEVTASFDSQQKIQTIIAYIYSYSL